MTAIDKFGLPGKVAVVTGGARGIGYAVASLSASVGADIAIIDILEEVGAASARDLAASSRKKVRFSAARYPDGIPPNIGCCKLMSREGIEPSTY